MLKKITLSLALILSVAFIALAADLFTGSWVGKLLIGSTERPLTYNLKAEGDKLTGSLASDQGEIPIIDGKIAGETITFKIDVNGTVIPHEGKLTGDTLKIKLIIQDNVIEGKFVKKK